MLYIGCQPWRELEAIPTGDLIRFQTVHVPQRGVEVADIVNMAAFGVVDAQSRKK